jgi:hypothetical protein
MDELQTHNDRTRPPDFLRVEEAAGVLRIGRTTAYALARKYLDTKGDSGLPVVRLGKQLRVPRIRLEQMLGGWITWPAPAEPVNDAELTAVAPSAMATPRHGWRSRLSSSDKRDLSLREARFR